MDTGSLVVISLLAALGVILFGIRDLYAFDRETLTAAGRNRQAWTALMVAFGPLAVLLYWGTVRFDLIDPSRLDPD